METLSGRIAMVTGASSGLGERFVRVLHGAGAHVVATARRADRLASLSESLGDRISVLAGDITSVDHRRALVGVAEEVGGLDILVNNAGVSDQGSFEDQTLENLVQVIDVNLTSAIDLTRLSIGLLKASPAGSIINVASMYGLVASRSSMPGYNASKAGLINLTRHLASLFGRDGIRVNALAPGYFPTEMTDNFSNPTLAQAVRDKTLLGRLPELDELDGPLLFLAGSASSYMTGQTLVIDGGWTAV